MLKGQLSRWLLPYNADTSVEEQQAATPRRLQESLQASVAASSAEAAGGDGGGGGGGGDTLTEQEAEYLTTGARRVRQLVRSGEQTQRILTRLPHEHTVCVYWPCCDAAVRQSDGAAICWLKQHNESREKEDNLTCRPGKGRYQSEISIHRPPPARPRHLPAPIAPPPESDIISAMSKGGTGVPFDLYFEVYTVYSSQIGSLRTFF